MPIQAETISGRAGGGRGLDLGGSGSAMRSQLGAWQKYGEEERALSKRYQQGFSKALQAETERWQPIADEISGHLDAFWSTRRAYDFQLGHYRAGRSRKRSRRIRNVMHGLSVEGARLTSNIQKAFAKLDYRPPSWEPPELGKEPETGDLQEQGREISRPQGIATTARPTIGTDLGTETAPIYPDIEGQIGGAKAKGLQMREREAGTYKRLLEQNADIYGNLRSSIGGEVERAEGLSWPY